jgi:uncharacterized membrane protein
MRPLPAFLPILFVLVLLFLFPLFFAELMIASLAKLQLSPRAAAWIVAGIFLGSLVNIPVRRIARDRDMPVHPLAVLGIPGFPHRLVRTTRTTTIAVNVGGCVIPALVALWELLHLVAAGPGLLLVVLAISAVNVLACWLVARPVAGIGIAMPGFVSPVTAALLAILLAPEAAPQVAFVAGVLGPIVGADLLHLPKVAAMSEGTLSIGGAGTFDGIVLSGMVAAYLA